MASKKKATAISLPLSRTAKIMTSAVGIESVNPDIVALATKATEIFLMDFARRAYDQNSDEEFRSNVLEYDDIQKLVYSDSRYDFLTDTIPKRIKFSEALELVEKANKQKEETDRELQAAAERAKELKEARAKQKLLKEAEEEKVAKKAKLEQQVDGNQEQKQKQKHVKATNDEEKAEENDENEVDEKSDVEQSLNDKE